MNQTEILRAILSKDETRVTEAKGAIKALLDARATQFRSESSKFVAKSLFEATQPHDFKPGDTVIGDHIGSVVVHKIEGEHIIVNKADSDVAGGQRQFRIHHSKVQHQAK